MRLPASGRISQGFTTTHQAVDIAGEFDSPIVAPHAGRITAAGQMGSGTNDAGLAIDIDGGRFKSRLAHNNRITVSVGQVVAEGQQVGTQGYTGYTQPDNVVQGTHCHWVLWDNGTRVDGRKYITANEEKGMFMIDKNLLFNYFRIVLGRPPTETENKTFVGMPADVVFQTIIDSQEYKNLLANQEYVPVTEQLYRRK